MAEIRVESGVFWRDGRRRFVIAVDYQYYRDRRENWGPRLAQLSAGGANTITCYVPWRHHFVPTGADPKGEHVYDFAGLTRANRDLLGFIEEVIAAGLDLIVKPGPFVHSELNIGGLPDRVSPSFVDDIEAARKHDGSPLIWEYDDTVLPAPLDPVFDGLAREWLEAVGAVLAPYWPPRGPIIGAQINDETLYCSSNAPPWDFGYEASSLAAYRAFCRERYGAELAPPRPGEGHADPSTWRSLIAWGEWQWRLRRDAYARYKGHLGVPAGCPALTNFAGITPPIEENVPGVAAEARPAGALDGLYAEWWLAMNRVDADRDLYHYGMISWLGVAAYGIPDPRTTELPASSEPNAVFRRYINTASRRRGLNMEENWGFSKLYHPFSGDPIVPFFQTLASVAGGCTGYVVFCGVQHAHWDDELDRKTRKQWPTFPAAAPLGPEGEETPMYAAMALLNAWFAQEGEAFLAAERRRDATWLIYPPYAAVSGWLAPGLSGAPRCGSLGGLEEAAESTGRAGYSLGMLELDSASAAELRAASPAVLRLGAFMDEASQRRLVEALEGGLELWAFGQWPERDLESGRPCSLLREAAGRLSGLSFAEGEDFLASGAFVAALKERGPPVVEASASLAAFCYGDGARAFVFFFDFGREPGRVGFIRGPGFELELGLGCKTCGALALDGGRPTSLLIKGRNEVEGQEPELWLRCGAFEWRGRGDALARFD